MKLPKSWNEVTVNQWVELNSIDPNEFNSVFLHTLEILSILSDTDPEELEDLTPEELIDLASQVSFIKREPSNKPKQAVKGFMLKPLDALTLGEFIDLEYYISQTTENFTLLLSILYKRWKRDDWGNLIFEPYVYKLNERTDLFNEVSINEVFGAVNNYVNYSNDFKKRYENLFNPVIEEIETEELDEDDLKAEAEEKVFTKWSWEKLLYDIANEDLTKIDAVTDLPLVFVFNMLSMVEELQLNKA
jgi:hypothetical protein